MGPHGRLSFLGTCSGIVIISCCFLGIIGEIKDGFVYTDLLKTVRKGDKISLRCEFLGAPVAVYWKKGNDPHKSPTLITWLDNRKWQGDCAENNLCDIDENFSLIIRNVTIADTGRYICRVSNYLGHLIYNITDLHVFEPPQEPYPVIKECNDSSALGKDYGCVILSPTPINLTCSASGFYPGLDLFFLYGSEKITRVDIQEWTNEDGTRSKSVSISAVPHDTPYVCVASDVPGDQKERAVTVFVSPAEDDTITVLTGSTTKPPQDVNVLIIIIVPLLFVAILGVCIFIVCWRRHHHNDRKHGRHDAENLPLMEGGVITGELSFYDLWVMVSKATASDNAKLHNTLLELGITKIGVPGELIHLDAYQHLCKWKSDNIDNKSEILLAALKKSEYTAAWNDICDVRKNCEMISGGILEHILWQIGDPRKIDKFLSELIPGRTVRNFDVTEKITKIIEEPLGELREWSKGSIDTNPLVSLSLALECAGCSSVDRTFFCVPDQPVSSDEVQRFVKSLTRRHCESLAKIINLTSDDITLIVDENQNDLFDTESMIIDWLAQSNSSNIDKRCQLNHAAINIGRHDLKGYFADEDRSTQLPNTGHAENTKVESVKEGEGFDYRGSDLSDEELHRIVKYLEPAQIAASLKEKADDEEEGNFDLLKTWVKREISAGLSISCRRVLRNKLEPHGNQALIPAERKEDVCLVELADIAFRLMMMDVYPLADALKIFSVKLKRYKRKSLREYQLSRGTVGILVKFCQSTNYARGQLCDALALVAGMREMAHLLIYGYQVSHSDLFSVALGEGPKKEQCARIRDNLGIISETEEEAEDIQDMLKDWRSMINSPTYNLKGALADAVFPVLGKEKALEILSGAVISSGIQNGNVISFIGDTIMYNQASHIADVLDVKHSSSERMKVTEVLNVWKDSMKNRELNDSQRGQLCRRLTDKRYKNFSSKLRHGELLVNETEDFIEEMEKTIQCDVTAGLAEILEVKLPSERTPNVKDILQKWEEKLRKKSLTQQERIDLSNKLFKEGYTDFSVEIMLGFVPKPLEHVETSKKETTVKGIIKEAVIQSATHLFQGSQNSPIFYYSA